MPNPVLTSGQRLGHRVAIGLYGVLALTGAVLVLPVAGFPALVVHIALGAVLLLVLAVFVWSHRARVEPGADRAASRLGAGVALLAALGLLSGAFLAVAGAPRTLGGLRWLHVAASLLLVAPWLLHALRRDRRVQARPAVIVSVLAVLALGSVVAPLYWRSSVPRVGDPFPDLARPALLGGRPEALVGAGACAGCHADIARQWEESSHHLSSINNPWHRRAMQNLARTRGAREAAVCAACHSPAVFLAGHADAQAALEPDSDLGNAGINCVTCHAAVHAEPGPARYVVDSALAGGVRGGVLDPRSKSGQYWQRAYPEAHREAMLKPLHRTAEFCASCHRVELEGPITGGRRIGEPSAYDEWRTSQYSGRAVDTLRAPAPASCVDCHMPRVASSDPAAVAGTVRSHRFTAANTWNAEYHGLDEQRLQTEAFLKDRVALTVLPVRARGGKADLTLLAANRGVGHTFPTGSVDLHDIWLDVAVRDAGGRLLLHSGALDEQGRGAPGAHRYGILLLDGQGRPIEKHDVWNARKLVYERRIPAGGVDVARYRFALPAGTRWPLRVVARMQLRKFAPAFHDFSFPNGVVTPLSTVSIGSVDTRVAADAGAAPAALVDWGIGLLLEGNARAAGPVLGQAVGADGTVVDAWLALSRARRESGDAAGALAAAEKALALAPGDPRGVYARALAWSAAGRISNAAAALRGLAQEFPQDEQLARALLRATGRADEARALEAESGKAVLPRADAAHDGWLRRNPDAALEGTPGHVHGD